MQQEIDNLTYFVDRGWVGQMTQKSRVGQRTYSNTNGSYSKAMSAQHYACVDLRLLLCTNHCVQQFFTGRKALVAVAARECPRLLLLGACLTMHGYALHE
jgi:hypothetical protein